MDMASRTGRQDGAERRLRNRTAGLRRRLLVRDEAGQNLVEYGLVVGLIGLAAVAVTSGMSTQLRAAFSTMGSALSRYV